MANVSKVAICNIALGNIGVGKITNAEFEASSSTVAGLCNQLYDNLRDAVLEAHEWQFAIARAKLAADAGALPWGQEVAFPLPNDCLRLLYASDSQTGDPSAQIEYYVERNRVICAKIDTLYIKYLRKVVDANDFSPSFVQALAARLSIDLAMPLTNSATLMSAMANLFQSKMDEAKTLDGMQGRKRQQVVSSLDAARRGGR